MSDYIKRDDAIDVIRTMMSVRPLDSDRYVLSDVKDRLRRVSSADVVERKKGEWITVWVYKDEESGYWKLKCSACGKSRFYDMTKYPFCPSCGAYMRGENNAD